jgi:hypothetical protein
LLKRVFVGTLHDDGGILKKGEAVGFVTVAGKVIDVLNGKASLWMALSLMSTP